tara:strand:+ start:4634 stop:5281 length:648 start_codon:yes stop_codon:yes gene_type:complete
MATREALEKMAVRKSLKTAGKSEAEVNKMMGDMAKGEYKAASAVLDILSPVDKERIEKYGKSIIEGEGKKVAGMVAEDAAMIALMSVIGLGAKAVMKGAKKFIRKRKQVAPVEIRKNVKSGKSLVDFQRELQETQREFQKTKRQVEQAKKEASKYVKGMKTIRSRLATTSGREHKNVLAQIAGLRRRASQHNKEKLNPLRQKLNDLGMDIKNRSK